MAFPSDDDASRLLPLTPAVFHILLALSGAERHGYGIMQEVQGHSGGKVRMGPGTLYGTLQRLMDADLVDESSRRPPASTDDPRRRYYRLTRLGRRVLSLEVERMAALVQVARTQGA